MSTSAPLQNSIEAVLDNYSSSVRSKKLMSFHSVDEQTVPIENKLPTYDAKALTKGVDQAQIVLGDQIYTLRITRAGKLLLTK
jgi:hemin uptake protein HemP|tara:strand:- start:2995 stop:3243 length:249 start_codon:yes stop_codon:yes gene_type:complete